MGWRRQASWVGLFFVSSLACGRSSLEPGEVGAQGEPSGSGAQGGSGTAIGGSGGSVSGRESGQGGKSPGGTGGMLGNAGATQAGSTSESRDFCSVDGWCWMNPLPQGNDLHAALRLGPDVYFAGDVGMLFRYDGQSFWRLESPTQQDLIALWGPTPNDLWALTRSELWHGVDGKWQLMRSSERAFGRVHGTSSSDIWVAGKQLDHWDGKRWSTVELPEPWPAAIWAPAPGQLWIAGDGIGLYEGGTLTQLPEASGRFHDVWGDADEAWAVGERNLRCTRAGCADLPLPQGELSRLAASSKQNIWAVGERAAAHFDGESWRSDLAGTTAVDDLVLDPALRPIAVGALGAITRLEQADWQELAPGARAGFSDIWGAAADDVWLVGGPVYRSDGVNLVEQRVIDQWGVVGVHGTAPDDVWLVGYNGKIARYDGTGFADFTIVPWEDQFDHFFSVFAPSRHDAWTVGSWGISYRFDGARFQHAPGGTGSRAVHGLASDYVFAVDHYGVLEKFDGIDWTRVAGAGAGSSLLDVWVSQTGTAWVAGGSAGDPGILARYRESDGWHSFGEDESSPQYQGIYGLSDRDVWAAGYRKLVHFDGERWSEEQTGAGTTLSDVWAASPEDVWLIGHGGAVLRKRR